MRDADNERRLIYGLRHRASGEMLRVESRSDLAGDPESPYAETYHEFTTDPSYPIYDAGSAERLALAFCRPQGSREQPLAGGFRPGDVEAVEIEEVLTRRVRPTGRPFEVPVALDIRYAIDMDRRLARYVEGLVEVLDVVDEHAAELAGERYPGSPYPWGKFYLVGLLVPGEPGDVPEGALGGIVSDANANGNGPRRALAALAAPADYLKLASRRGADVAAATVLVCLGDTRAAPPALMEALGRLSTAAAPGPR